MQFPLTVLAVPVPPDITILATPATVSAAPGTSATFVLALTRNIGTIGMGNIGLAVSGLPEGASATFTPPVPQETAQLEVAIPAGTRETTYSLLVTATLGSIVKTAAVNLVVATPPNFTLKLTPAAITVSRGGSAEVVVELQRTGPASNIVLDAQAVPAVYSATPVPALVSATATTSRLTVAVNALATAGTYNIPIRGTSGSLSKSATLVLTIPAPPPNNVTISVLTPSARVASGGTTQIPIRLTRTGTAVGQLLELRSAGVPAGGNALDYSVNNRW